MKNETEKITSLLFEKIAGTIHAADDAWIEHKIATSPAVKKLWIDIQQFYQEEEHRSALHQMKPATAWQQVAPQLHADQVQIIPIKKKKFPLRPILGAASIFLLITLGWWLWLFNNKHETIFERKTVYLKEANGRIVDLKTTSGSVEKLFQQTPVRDTSWSTLIVPATKDYVLTLSDGSEIHLNAESTLRFQAQLSGKKRIVYLTGEAYFRIKKDATKPFIVETPYSSIEVLGTAFNVNTYQKESYRASLVEGAIKNTMDKKDFILSPGYQLSYNKEGQQEISPFNQQDICGWMAGMYVFKEQALVTIIPVIERWFAVKVSLQEPSIGQKKFTGAIDKNLPLEHTLEVLKISGNLNSEISNGKLLLSL